MKNVIFSIILSLLFTNGAWAENTLPKWVNAHYRSNWGIEADMRFQRNAEQYAIVATIHIPKYVMKFESGGQINNGILYPSYYRDIRNGQLYASAKITENTVIVGKVGDMHRYPKQGHVMDLFTLAWQLAFRQGKMLPSLTITNGKKLYPVGYFNAIEPATLKINQINIMVNQYRMAWEKGMVNYAISPEINHIPIQISYTDNSKQYRFILSSFQIQE